MSFRRDFCIIASVYFICTMQSSCSKRWAVTLAALLLSFITAFAQHVDVTVLLQDASTGEAISFATVSLTAEGSSQKPKYALTDKDGRGKIERVRTGKYTFQAEMMGYITFKKEVSIEHDKSDLGTIKMELDNRVLDAASVSASGNPVIIKKDTIEYNASSFKVSDDNMLIDLLKKLPGIEVDENGTITSGGKEVNKITIGGKTFFLDDPQLASNNIPAKLIEKVKVVKKKSEQAEFTGIDDGEEETVIDLSVKKGMMHGLFGNAQLGGGHDLPSSPLTFNDGDWRYQGAFMGGRFTDDSQISVILNANNTNNRGFNDIAGNMMNSMGGGGRGRNGGGWGRTNGILESWMGGVNGNWDLFDKKMELGSNYLYNGTNTDVEESTYKETYLEDGSTLISNDEGFSNRKTGGHRLGIRLEHKFSENTSILFQPQLEIGNGNYNQLSRFSTETLDAAGIQNPTNEGFSLNSGDSKSVQTRGFFLFRQRLGIPGRTISANLTWNFSRNELDSWNQSVTDTYDGDPSVINQRIDQCAISRSLGSRIVYTEPLGYNLYLEASYQYRWNKNNTDKLAYNSGDLTDYDIAQAAMRYYREGESKDDDYSNTILNRYVNQSAGLALMYQEGKTRAQLGFSANPTNTHNETNGNSYDDNRVNWAPRAMLFYDFNDNSNIRLFYFGRSAQPSTSQLMPVLDNSNPLSMALGNPYLTPYFNHSTRSEFEYSNKKTFFTLRMNLEGGYVNDPIVSAMWYDSGVQYSMPVNGDDSYNGSVRVMINTPIARSNFSISNTTRISYSKSGSYIGSAAVTGIADNYFNADRTDFDYTRFHAEQDIDALFLANTTQSLTAFDRFRATYRSDNLEVILGGRVRVSKPWYSLDTASENATWGNSVTGSFNWTVGQTGLEIKTDADYNWYRGYTTEQPSELVWNAQISKTLFKRQATLTLRAYDILDKAKNLTVTDASNYHREVRNNTLGRYIMLSLTWRFGNFGKAREQMRSRMGGPGGFGGGRRPF